MFAALSLAGFLASLSPVAAGVQPIDTPEILAAARDATTRRDHEAVAKYYEDAATQLRAKVKEQKELLEQYQNKSYLYGKQSQDLQSHAEALIRDYEQAVTATVQEADLHRQMAAKLKEETHVSDTQQINSVTGL